MRQYRSLSTFLGGILLVAAPVIAQAPHSSINSPRSYDGWQAAPKGAAGAKQAYFQTPGAQWENGQLPAVPAGFGGATLPPSGPAYPGVGEMPLQNSQRDAGVQPAGGPLALPAGGPLALYDQFSNPGGQLPPTDVRQASGARLRDDTSNSQPVYPPQGFQQPGSGVYPPPNYSQAGAQQPNMGQAPRASLRSINPQGGSGASYNTISQQQQLHNGYQYSVPIVTQDPRIISPPPAPRVGNYATSPYQPYRMAAYQVNQQVPAQTVQAPFTQPTQPAVVANTSSLPQFQPGVGIHPTAYQTGYQYCAPGIPTNGVPQLVPGAVVPPTLPPNMTPQLYTPDNAGYKPLFSLGQENYNVLLGRGVIGQPTVYVPGQPVRNFLRYISP